MLRLIGAALVFAACGMVGWQTAAMFRLRAEQLEAFARLISHIGAQVDIFRAPLDRIYAAWGDRVLEACGFLAALREKGGPHAMRICGARLYLSPTETAELTKFFSGLGQCGADEEMRHIAFYEKRIGEMSAATKNELVGRMKICRCLGVLAGLLLALLFL